MSVNLNDRMCVCVTNVQLIHMSQAEQNGHSMADIIHSDQPRERLRRLGPRALSSAELLSIIIGTGSRDENALQLSHRTLSTFGSLPGVSRASITELTNIEGIGPAKAMKIKSAFELGRRLLAVTEEPQPKVTTPADAANLLMADMSTLEQQELRAIILDTRNRIIDTPTVYQGNYASVLRTAEVFRTAIRVNAAAILVAHNKPNGDLSPSPQDVAATRDMVETGKLLDIQVLDHIIIGQQRWVSLRERGLGFTT